MAWACRTDPRGETELSGPRCSGAACRAMPRRRYRIVALDGVAVSPAEVWPERPRPGFGALSGVAARLVASTAQLRPPRLPGPAMPGRTPGTLAALPQCSLQSMARRLGQPDLAGHRRASGRPRGGAAVPAAVHGEAPAPPERPARPSMGRRSAVASAVPRFPLPSVTRLCRSGQPARPSMAGGDVPSDATSVASTPAAIHGEAPSPPDSPARPSMAGRDVPRGATSVASTPAAIHGEAPSHPDGPARPSVAGRSAGTRQCRVSGLPHPLGWCRRWRCLSFSFATSV